VPMEEVRLRIPDHVVVSRQGDHREGDGAGPAIRSAPPESGATRFRPRLPSPGPLPFCRFSRFHVPDPLLFRFQARIVPPLFGLSNVPPRGDRTRTGTGRSLLSPDAGRGGFQGASRRKRGEVRRPPDSTGEADSEAFGTCLDTLGIGLTAKTYSHQWDLGAVKSEFCDGLRRQAEKIGETAGIRRDYLLWTEKSGLKKQKGITKSPLINVPSVYKL
jgi:hypothetical protein